MLLAAPDAQWIAVRHGREVALVVGIDQAAAGEVPPMPGTLTLDEDDCDLAFAGVPSVLVAVHRGSAPRVVLYQVPALEPVATLALDAAMRLAAITGPRLALVSLDGKHVLVVRVASRALSSSAIEPGTPVELAVGLERNQLLLGLTRKLEVWDAVSARPLLRLQLQLPPPPRTVGAAQGHLWATRPGSDEVFVYRLSDGRPFRHHVGSPVEDVICHPASPVIVVVTARGLVRLHCFAHSVALIEAPWTRGTPLALLVLGEDLSLIGGAGEPWRVPIGASAAPSLAPIPEPAAPTLQSAADKLRAMRERWPENQPGEPAPESARPASAQVRMIELPSPRPARVASPTGDWRAALAGVGATLVAGGTAELPLVREGELAVLADRLGVSDPARRALGVLYALYLVGEPALSIARLAHALADWTEPLGGGELGELAMLRRRGGRVALRAAVTDLLDGLAPRCVRLIGDRAIQAPGGATRLARLDRSDTAITSELAARLGRIAVIEGAVAAGLLEARLHGATAITLAAPRALPAPWPRDAGLVVIADVVAPSWVAALPSLDPTGS